MERIEVLRQARCVAIAAALHIAVLAELVLFETPPHGFAFRARPAIVPTEVVIEETMATLPEKVAENRGAAVAESSVAHITASSRIGARRGRAGSAPGTGPESPPQPEPSSGGADEYDDMPVEHPNAGLPWALLPPPAAPTETAKRRRLTGEDVTRMLTDDVLAKDAELGLRMPETWRLVEPLITHFRHAAVPNGTRVTFVIALNGGGEVTSVAATRQSAGDSAIANAVAASVLASLKGKKIGVGAFKSGAVVEIVATVIESKPSGSTTPVKVQVDCPEEGRMGKARELRDIPDTAPLDPNSPSWGSVAIGGELYHAKKTVDDYAPCYGVGGSFDLSDIGATSKRHVRTRVRVRRQEK